MKIVIKPHAKLRMKDRRITKNQIQRVLLNPIEVIVARYGRLAAYGEIVKKNKTLEVITAPIDLTKFSHPVKIITKKGKITRGKLTTTM
jgi:hypothetical protein